MSPSIIASTASKLNNSKVTIITNDDSGRGLQTTQSITGGSLLVRLDPLISVLDESMLDKACSHCFVISKSLDATIGKELLKCTGCGFLRYCSKICQKKDWKTHHSRECKVLQLNANTPPALVRGVMRLVNLYAGDERELAFAEDVAQLMSHMDKIEQSQRWEIVEQISQGIGRITVAGGGKPLSPDGLRGIQQLVCKFLINSITLVSATFDSLGLTFDPTIALLNHSCNPNCAIVFDGNVASIRSIRDIRSGEQLTISYIDNTFKRATRRRQLRDQYFFECHCIGCEPLDKAKGYTGRDSFLCEKCNETIPEPELRGEFKCFKCHSEQAISIEALRSLEVKAFTALETPPPTMSANTLVNEVLLPTLQSLTTCPNWPAIRQPAPSIRRQIYHLSLDSQNFSAAYHHANLLSTTPLLNIHPEPFHPLKTVAIFTTASLLALVAAQEGNVEYLKRTWELLKLSWGLCRATRGETSDFAKRIAAKRAQVEQDLSMGGEEMRQWLRNNS